MGARHWECGFGFPPTRVWKGVSRLKLQRGGPGPAADLSADVFGAAGSQRASLRLREGPLAYLPGAAILFFVGSVTLLYPQATDNDSEGDPKKNSHCLPEELN